MPIYVRSSRNPFAKFIYFNCCWSPKSWIKKKIPLSTIRRNKQFLCSAHCATGVFIVSGRIRMMTVGSKFPLMQTYFIDFIGIILSFSQIRNETNLFYGFYLFSFTHQKQIVAVPLCAAACYHSGRMLRQWACRVRVFADFSNGANFLSTFVSFYNPPNRIKQNKSFSTFWIVGLFLPRVLFSIWLRTVCQSLSLDLFLWLSVDVHPKQNATQPPHPPPFLAAGVQITYKVLICLFEKPFA